MITVEAITRWFPAIFFSAVAIFYGLRISIVKARRGVSPVFAGHAPSLHFVNHMAFRLFRAVIWLVSLARAIWPETDQFLMPINALWRPVVMLTGNALLLTGFGVVVAVHFYMGANWRSGTKPGDQADLIVSGPYKYSRNPMMIGVQIAQLGLFLAIPSVFTLVCLVIGIAAVQAQVRVEERMLADRFSLAYDGYRRQTPRWFGRRQGARRPAD